MRLAAVAAVVGFLAAWPLYAQLYHYGGDKPLVWEDITTIVRSLRFRDPETRVFDTEEELSAYVSGRTGRTTQIVSAGDPRRYVLTTVGPRSSSSYKLRVERVVEERGRILVLLREETPRLEQAVRPRVTSPFILLALPAGDKPVRVELERRP